MSDDVFDNLPKEKRDTLRRATAALFYIIMLPMEQWQSNSTTITQKLSDEVKSNAYIAADEVMRILFKRGETK